jgi:H3 lysine-79-specific histone-lysine N-methyltransferase
MDGKEAKVTNGNGLSRPHNGQPLANGGKPALASKPVLKRPPSGITVSTVKRTHVPNRPSLSTSISSSAQPIKRPYNALPEETRRRIEEQRREKERAIREKEELERAQRRASSTPVRTHKNGASKKKKVKRPLSSDDDDGDDTPKKRRDGKSLTPTSSSNVYKKLGRFGVTPDYHVARDLLNKASFTPNATNADDDVAGKAMQSVDLVIGKKYGQYFHGLEHDARVSLEYPADGCTEEFALLAPKDREEYDPISDLLRTVRCIVEFYVSEEQQQDLFGSLESLEISSTAGNLLSNGRGSATPADSVKTLSPLATASSSREGTPATLTNGAGYAKASSASQDSAAKAAIVAHATSALTPTQTDSRSEAVDKDSILRSFTKARNRRDGPLFVRTVGRFNAAMQILKAEGSIRENVAAMSEKGVKEGIWRWIQEQCYARTVAPRVEELSKYEAFSDNVYGELLPRFMSEIAQLTSLGPDSVFVDLGSGVGNLLIQVALQTGSQSLGCEQMAAPSELANVQIQEAKRRWRMWGLNGARTEAWHGDFMQDDRVAAALRQADVILVNNYAFTAKTNDTLSLLFLDLKEGAHIVSLKPFVPPDFRLTNRTISSPLSILRVAQRTYTSGCVSWADGGGRYYIHTVDRTLQAKFMAENGDGPREERKKQWKAGALEASEEQ